jgi:hypothetical protein
LAGANAKNFRATRTTAGSISTASIFTEGSSFGKVLVRVPPPSPMMSTRFGDGFKYREAIIIRA